MRTGNSVVGLRAFNEWQITEVDTQCAGLDTPQGREGGESANGKAVETAERAERGRNGRRGALIGDYVLKLAKGDRSRTNINGFISRINDPLQGCRVLLMVKITVAVQDAIGAGLTLKNERRQAENIISNAWAYLESPEFPHDLDHVGLGNIDVNEFLRQLKECSENDGNYKAGPNP